MIGNSYGIYIQYFVSFLIFSDKLNMNDGSAPELIDFEPTNITVYQNTRIVMQCKIFSIHPVEIRWFKVAQEGFIFQNKSYIRLNSSDHIFFDKDIYQSKLIIDKASVTDTGIYKCAAINSLGVVYREAYVNVLSQLEITYWQDSTSLPLLFFIPVGLALIPILVWLWYYRRKRNIRKREVLATSEKNNSKYYAVF